MVMNTSCGGDRCADRGAGPGRNLRLFAARKRGKSVVKKTDPFYLTRRWKKLRAAILRRDGYLCQISKRYGRTAEADMVHHIYPREQFPEYAFCAWNLISLSHAAHNRLHNREDNSLTAEGLALMRATIPPTPR